MTKDTAFESFWRDMELCDRARFGDDQGVLSPLIHSLAQRSDSEIFAFHDQMAALLFRLDTKILAKKQERLHGRFCEETFLHSRCWALMLGPEYYRKALTGKERMVWAMEFKALLHVPAGAWALKHHRAPAEYPHEPPFCLKSGSNPEGWK